MSGDEIALLHWSYWRWQILAALRRRHQPPRRAV